MIPFSWSSPTTYNFGAGANEKVGAVAAQKGYKKALIHYGGGSCKQSFAGAKPVFDVVVDSLKAAGIEYVEAGGQTPNPQKHICDRAADIYVQSGCDFIVGLGGGSVIDSAKYVSAVIASKQANVDPWLLSSTDGTAATILEKLNPFLPPLMAVLTMSATGSEMNSGGVITRVLPDHKSEKFGVFIQCPIASFVDPAVQSSLPAWQTACGAMDIVSHCLEQLTSLLGFEHLPETAFALAEANIRAVFKCVPPLLEDPTNTEVRGDLCWAATMGLNHILHVPTGGDWAVHMAEHAVSAASAIENSSKSVTHGAGLGVITCGYFLWLDQQDKKGRFSADGSKGLKRLFRLLSGDKTEEPHAAIQLFRERLASWGLPTNMKELLEPFDIFQGRDMDFWARHFARLTVEHGSTGSLFAPNEEELTEIFRLSE